MALLLPWKKPTSETYSVQRCFQRKLPTETALKFGVPAGRKHRPVRRCTQSHRCRGWSRQAGTAHLGTRAKNSLLTREVTEAEKQVSTDRSDREFEHVCTILGGLEVFWTVQIKIKQCCKYHWSGWNGETRLQGVRVDVSTALKN